MKHFRQGKRYSFTPQHDGVKRVFRVLKLSNEAKEPTIWFYENKLTLLNFNSKQSYTIDMWLEKWMLTRESCKEEPEEDESC